MNIVRKFEINLDSSEIHQKNTIFLRFPPYFALF